MDALPKVRSKLRAARKLVPDVQARIRLKQGLGDVRNGRELLKGLDDRLEEAVTLVEEMLDSAPTPQPPPEPEPEPPTIPGPWPDNMPKPPDPTKVSEGKTYTGSGDGTHLNLAGLKNFAFRKNRFINSDMMIVHGDAGRGVIIADSFVDGMRGKEDSETHGAHPFFPGTNWQTSDDPYDIWFMGLEFGKNNKVQDEFELKGSYCHVIGNQGTFKVRIRHGVGSIVMNNPGCLNVSVRCGPHFVGNMPECRVMLYAGNLDGRKGHWEPDSGAPDEHEPAGGHNMQSCVETSVAGVREVVHGYHFGDNDKKYPASGCIIDPSLKDKTKIVSGVPIFRTVTGPVFKAQRAMERMAARRTRDVALAPVDDRNREDEVYDWFMEYTAALLKAGVP